MAFALVGTAGAISSGAAATAVTPVWGAGETRAAGNLLVCWVMSGGGSATTPVTPAGWTLLGSSLGTASAVFIFGKIAAGGDAAPTIAAGGGSTNWQVSVAEFSGNPATLAVDKSGIGDSTTLPLVVNASAADSAVGDLVLYCGGLRLSAANTTAGTATLNNGATASSKAIAVGTNHAVFGYGITTGNPAANQVTFSDAGVALVDAAGLILSIALPAAPTPPPPITPPTSAAIKAYSSSAGVRAYSSSGAVRAYSSSSAITAYLSSSAIKPYTSSGSITQYTGSALIRFYTSNAQVI